MPIVRGMPFKCWDCLILLVEREWRWRPEGYTGVVCDQCAERHHSEGKIMTRQYGWRECGLCHLGAPDLYMTCVADHSTPLGHSFHHDCFIEASYNSGEANDSLGEKGPFCPKCQKRCKEPVPVGSIHMAELVELDHVEDLTLNIWDYLKEAHVDPECVTLSIESVMDVGCIPYSSLKYGKVVRISWRVSVNDGEAGSGAIIPLWESYSCLNGEPELREKADRRFERMLWFFA
ncbi:hypothetical protein FOYG_03471 [Fusarium oxysporum NRRL 32931]|uniref:Uncharacterized protein n=1 Tax=Fusarium oxysporum NRRL 32931 TaxID=660029 RepID=W9J3S4_FUSOX|nr:hypothetical protein FOYG_03471 [Fusarium oxysporum NRRL 32931]